MFILRIFLGENICGNLPGNVFHDKVSLNRSNHSIAVQISQHIRNTFNIASTNYLTYYKSFNVVQRIQRITNHVQFI